MNFSILGNGRISCLINGWPFVLTLLEWLVQYISRNSFGCLQLCETCRFHFRQRMKHKFDMSLLLFWSTSWLIDKVTKLSPGPFLLVSKVTEEKIM